MHRNLVLFTPIITATTATRSSLSRSNRLRPAPQSQPSGSTAAPASVRPSFVASIPLASEYRRYPSSIPVVVAGEEEDLNDYHHGNAKEDNEFLHQIEPSPAEAREQFSQSLSTLKQQLESLRTDIEQRIEGEETYTDPHAPVQTSAKCEGPQPEDEEKEFGRDPATTRIAQHPDANIERPTPRISGSSGKKRSPGVTLTEEQPDPERENRLLVQELESAWAEAMAAKNVCCSLDLRREIEVCKRSEGTGERTGGT